MTSVKEDLGATLANLVRENEKKLASKDQNQESKKNNSEIFENSDNVSKTSGREAARAFASDTFFADVFEQSGETYVFVNSDEDPRIPKNQVRIFFLFRIEL